MKIGIVIEHFNPRRGGAETYTAGLVESLAASGHEVSVITEDWSAVPAGVKMVPVRPRGVTAAGRCLSFATEASEAALSGGFDVVHSMARIMALSVFQPHGGVTKAAVARSLASSESQWERGLRKAARWLNTKSDMLLEIEEIIYSETPLPRFVAVSNIVASDMMRYYGVPASKIDVVYNGVDVCRFRPENRQAFRQVTRERFGIGDADVLLLLVAHNYRLKGADVFIRAVAAMRAEGHERVRGLIVGGRDFAAYERLARKLGAGDRVSFSAATDDIERVYAAADVYLHPTYYDPMSLVVLEAMAAGLPVITTRYNGASEIMSEGVEGFSVAEPRDLPAIVAGLGQLVDDARRRDMGAAARALAERFPLERNFEGIMAVYAKAVEEGLPAKMKITRGA